LKSHAEGAKVEHQPRQNPSIQSSKVEGTKNRPQTLYPSGFLDKVERTNDASAEKLSIPVVNFSKTFQTGVIFNSERTVQI
jgi:hypothetical protein